MHALALAVSAALAVPGSPAAATTAAVTTQPCHAAVHVAVVPPWARAGFSDPRPRMPLELGRRGGIVALFFGYPLLSPASSTRGNKILWVSRLHLTPSADLHISAQRMAGTQRLGRPVSRIVDGGPGPSLIDLPAAGCWRLSLHWSGHSDSLDVRFVRR